MKDAITSNSSKVFVVQNVFKIIVDFTEMK